MDPVQDPAETGADDTGIDNDDGLNLTEEQRTQLKADEDFILNWKDEDADDPEKVARLEKIQKDANILKTAIHQKNHYRNKVKGDGGKKPAPAAPAAAPKAPAAAQTPAEDDRWSKTAITDFRLDNPTIPKAVVDSVVKYAKANNMTLDEAAADPVMKKIISEKKTTAEVEDASINSSGRKPQSAIESRDWSNASRQEIEEQRLKMMGQG